jgi:hypothetical protein
LTELDFPPLRDLRAALPLAAFGLIACALSTIGAGVMLAASSSGAAGLLATMLMIGFVAPFGIFGAVFVGLAIYMAANRLAVTVGEDGVATRRSVFGMVVARQRIGTNELALIEPEIVSRYQRLFDPAPIYRLVARDAARRIRVVVAESLRGEARMAEVRSRIERAAGLAQPSG